VTKVEGKKAPTTKIGDNVGQTVAKKGNSIEFQPKKKEGRKPVAKEETIEDIFLGIDESKFGKGRGYLNSGAWKTEESDAVWGEERNEYWRQII